MLKANHVSKIYEDGTKAITDINLHVQSGDIYGFIGANGAGKSTLIKSIVGIHPFNEGEISIDGYSMKNDPVLCKKRMAYIPDTPDLYEHLTGMQYINFIADIFEVNLTERESSIEKYSSLFEMTGKLHHSIASYSHGMKQRIAIIAALVHQPSLFILDEPFVGLDPTASFQLKSLMQKHADNGGAVFFSTHVLEVAQKLCNKVAIIHNGKLVKNGLMEEVAGSKTLEDIFMEVRNESKNMDII
ncbi:ABC transporter [Oceanobacillus oncorhynchi subsp. incaldanensis]|uniref:ABC-type transporter ATP-binding protein EcsA n=2 Tax=Oceanobacillus TaxID=182709 RepID=A0A0A1MBZ9_9BACI|nr:ABC transporter ATP-binding protein [Oceanobacillus oncorhynchi]MDM8100710.1 ABC transporter ATP-binding protein [Oceanobacillus oncorhynchi]UUI41432.1 ABC transporter ATP-binding protein [Oceanobacillus oncorhynchi]GIO17484.1 ABC transporter [Oceanobacillus oncorhynchi subsp. incaldanensis]CEI82865.1 ABC-type transporter ATP-binding protein EcsA [Oceanobacillus oncorhynchi]